LASKNFKLELHDCDEEIKADDPYFGYGKAKFSLKDLLNPYCKQLKLWSDVYPVKRTLLNMDSNLNLNATARKSERTIEKASPYLINSTYFNITVDLAHPIGMFNEEEEKKKI